MATSVLSKQTGVSSLDPRVIAKFDSLAPSDRVIVEYVWVDAVGNLRSKARSLPVERTTSVESIPKWNFDGSSTGQAPGDDSEVILKPCRIFRDPFRPRSDGINNILVICDTYTPSGEPIPTNSRAIAEKQFAGHESEIPWFGLEQEFTLFNLDERTPLGWPEHGSPKKAQGPYYCSVGPENCFGRAIVECAFKAMLYAGLEVSGTNGEVMPGQQEYQVGPCVGLDAADQLMMSRYILQRVCEDFQVVCSFHPKPIVSGEWNGAGMHTNISTQKMRDEGGMEYIKKAIYKLGARHQEHIAVYGKDNEKRLSGKYETANINQFSYGIANRGASVRIGRDTEKEGKGFFEDRRPASNADPYLVTGMIMETIMADFDAPEIPPKDRGMAHIQPETTYVVEPEACHAVEEIIIETQAEPTSYNSMNSLATQFILNGHDTSNDLSSEIVYTSSSSAPLDEIPSIAQDYSSIDDVKSASPHTEDKGDQGYVIHHTNPSRSDSNNEVSSEVPRKYRQKAIPVFERLYLLGKKNILGKLNKGDQGYVFHHTNPSRSNSKSEVSSEVSRKYRQKATPVFERLYLLGKKKLLGRRLLSSSTDSSIASSRDLRGSPKANCLPPHNMMRH